MGIMYKVLQRKDIKMDARRSANIAAMQREPLAVAEKEFTAEHILQLCKFLAEKSKRNKSLHKQRRESQCEEFCTNNSLAPEETHANAEAEALPLLQETERLSAPKSPAETATKPAKILSDKLSVGAINSDNASTQGKRDILLKIRRQIFERKRQRQLAQQLAHMQQHCGGGGVWRPW